jgi:hypothetical protein
MTQKHARAFKGKGKLKMMPQDLAKINTGKTTAKYI